MDIMLLYQYACACGQPVISGLPLQHAQGALLLSCKLRRRCLSRCLCRWWCLNRLWLALWSSRLRHVLLRFVLAPRGPRRFGSGAGAACGVVCGAACASCTSGASASCASGLCSVGSILFDYTWSRYNTKDKDDPRSRTTLPSRSVRRKRMCLRVTGPLRAIKCPSSEPVSTMVHSALQRDLGQNVVAQVAQHFAGVGQAGARSKERRLIPP